MRNIFVKTLEELEVLEENYNLQDLGMSGFNYGYHWLQDDDADIAVYFKSLEEEQ